LESITQPITHDFWVLVVAEEKWVNEPAKMKQHQSISSFLLASHIVCHQRVTEVAVVRNTYHALLLGLKFCAIDMGCLGMRLMKHTTGSGSTLLEARVIPP